MLCNIFIKQVVRYKSRSSSLPVLTLFSKAEGCSLCDDAKEVLMEFSDKFTFKEVDITAGENTSWFEKYKYDIPVVHINDVEVMRHRVFEKPLLQALEQAQARKVEDDS